MGDSLSGVSPTASIFHTDYLYGNLRQIYTGVYPFTWIQYLTFTEN